MTMRMGLMALAGALAVAGCAPESRKEDMSGRALFDQFCVACHGTSGRGDGPAAAGLPKKPADLTRISARNGGKFPAVKVMSTIDGYSRRDDPGSIMPELGAAMQESPTVMYDTGDGVLTPTPAALVALSDYLRSIQAP